MRQILKKIAMTFSALLLVGGFLLVPVQAVTAQGKSAVCEGVNMLDDKVKGDSCAQAGQGNDFSGLMKRIIDIFSMLVGAVSVIMIIIGGFRYIVSNGDSNGVSGAKNTILYAIIGLVIVLFAQIIVRFVLANATD